MLVEPRKAPVELPAVDPQWEVYQRRFASLPEFYFRSLEYPTSPAHAEKLLKLIQLEMSSIDAQFIERRAELESLEGTPLETAKTEHGDWKVRALRALRMKEAQIKILQSWLADNVQCTSSRLDQLEKQIQGLQKAMLALAAIAPINDEQYQEVVKQLI